MSHKALDYVESTDDLGREIVRQEDYNKISKP